MTAPAATSATASPSVVRSTTGGIDASCRLPLFALFGGAAFWLMVGSVLGLIASIKFHSPNFLADCAWLTYGRVYPASTNALVYGFCVMAGLGVGLWMLARLGRVPLARPWLVTVGAKLWHLGVAVGIIGILAGESTGFEWLEMPGYAALILFGAYLLMAACGFVTHFTRRERALYPSQWFILAALFWFPWIYSTANLLLLEFPVRGVVQGSIQWWFSGNLLFVWLGLLGLGASFYLVPKLSERPLQSHYLALFVFWTLILFATWVGIPGGAALPAWMPALSAAGALLTLVPAVGAALTIIQTTRGSKVECLGGPLCYAKFGVWSFVLSIIALAVSSLPQISRITDFTWFGTGRTQLLICGFFAMTMFGAVYHILPRITGFVLCPRLVRAHFWCGVIGVLLFALPLMIGGIAQGLKLANPGIAFVDLAKSTMMYLRLSTVGELLLVAGNGIFLFNVGAALVRHYRAVCSAAYADATAALQPAEARP